MSGFCPDGYLPTPEAVARAAECWFTHQFAGLKPVSDPQPQTKQDNSIDAAVRVFSQPQVSEAWRHAFEQIANQTVQRLRNFLHQGLLKGYYFQDDGCHALSRDFWATSHADGVIESGRYWPFGKPTRLYELRPDFFLFVLQSELDKLLSEQPARKRPFPRTKMPDLVAALRTLDDLPNREQQREALRKMPEFEPYHLTDDILREAEKQVPRKPGRKRPHPEQ